MSFSKSKSMSDSSMWTFQEDCESLIKQSTVMLISAMHDDDDDDHDELTMTMT